MPAHHLDAAVWKKAVAATETAATTVSRSHSSTQVLPYATARTATGPALMFTPADWTEFVDSAKDGEFDLNSESYR